MPRILAVDDTDEILKLVQGVAQRMGLVVAALNDTRHFMTTFVRFRPDIIVLDIVTPNIDGFEIIRWLMEVGYAGRLIILSGYADSTRMEQTLADAEGRLNVESLQKPFRIAELQAVLRGDPRPSAAERMLGALAR